MKRKRIKTIRRVRRKRRVRKNVHGTAEQPRLTVSRSLQHIYAQIVDDDRGVTLCHASSRAKDLREQIQYGGNIAAAKTVGQVLAERAKAKGIERVCFDRNGYKYHGRVKGLADAARQAGLAF
ncbi:MAG: 50S ribosomal protein L18 [Phycisphaerae bacterium]